MIRSVGLRSKQSAWDFHPFDVAVALGCWFDAHDVGTITESGGRVSGWADQSGNARHLSASGDARPWTGEDTTPAGGNCLTFDGEQRLVNAAYENISSNYQVFTVARFASAADAVNASTILDGYADESRNTIYRGTTDDFPGQTVFGNGEGQASWFTARDQWRVYAARRSIGFPTQLQLLVNGAAVGTGTPDFLLMFDGLSVGNVRGNPTPIASNRGMTGEIAFLCIFENILGINDQRNMLAWLSNRFGVYPWAP